MYLLVFIFFNGSSFLERLYLTAKILKKQKPKTLYYKNIKSSVL
ncbi:hypothetical protein HMPREF9074_07273 [Capnocytophaga sp. oral taxon 329 str. F0087]|nr:hypothetical protein HMPREF9074_07273 [Capnocytophaga sp. oral taxon 329 str. F0087]